MISQGKNLAIRQHIYYNGDEFPKDFVLPPYRSPIASVQKSLTKNQYLTTRHHDNTLRAAMEQLPSEVLIALIITFAMIGNALFIVMLIINKNSSAQKLSNKIELLMLKTYSGTESFNISRLVQAFGETMGVRCVVYAEITQQNSTMTTRSVWLDGTSVDNYSLPVNLSLAECILKNPVHVAIPVSSAAAKLDPVLKQINPIKCIAGTVYNNPENGTSALFFCIHDKPLQSLQQIGHLQKSISILASLELYRQDLHTNNMAVSNEHIRLQNIDAVGKLAGWLAHDFNNIISAISGYAGLLKKKLPQDDRCLNYVERIIEAGKNASLLTGQLGTLVKNSLATAEAIDVHAVMRNLTAELSTKHHSNPVFHNNLTGAETMIHCDDVLLRQNLVRLIENAVEACRFVQGNITLSTSNKMLESDHLICSSFDIPGGNYLTLSIQDNGIGISNDSLPQIFDPFFSTKKERLKETGLGLTHVYRFIKNIHGAINVSSAPDKGTEVTLYFPISNTENSVKYSKVQCIPAHESSTTSKNILIVDDEVSVRELYAEILSNHGYTIYTSIDGQQALEFICQKTESIDLILLDMVMPRLNGPETFKFIRQMHPSMRFIFMSGLANAQQLEQLLAEPGTVFLQKPCDDDKLIALITGMLASAEITV